MRTRLLILLFLAMLFFELSGDASTSRIVLWLTIATAAYGRADAGTGRGTGAGNGA